MSKAEAKINREMLMLGKDQTPRIGSSSNQSEENKLLIVGSKPLIPDLNAEPCSDSEGEENAEILITGSNPQDANDSSLPQLFNELQVEVFARVSCSKIWKMQFLNKRYSELLTSSEIFRLRQEMGLVKPYVLMLTGDNTRWTIFDKDFKSFQKLPEVPSDFCFLCCDKETICAGTQLLVIGTESKGAVVWRYELEMSKWFKGPSMITPRVMFGSASRGTEAFFAGGIKTNNGFPEVVTKAEKYNSETKTWTLIHEMHKRRQFSSGCFLHGKFYVIGGRDENDVHLTCGESYDEVTDTWELIPNMLKDMTFVFPHSPPLIAVVNDNLYLLETCFNELHVYDMKTNAWKKLGIVPVRADSVGGWGVAFKSIGDRLLLIGALTVGSLSETMSVYTCRPPSSNAEKMIWVKSNDCCQGRVRFSHFIRNCCVMFA